jgi:hypothetical protein
MRNLKVLNIWLKVVSVKYTRLSELKDQLGVGILKIKSEKEKKLILVEWLF